MSTVTHFAPAARAPEDVLRRQIKEVQQAALLVGLFDCLHEMVLLLNEQRQIVYANRSFREFRKAGDTDALLGMRPGEAVGCVHTRPEDAPNGCGTSEFCRACGAVMAILVSQRTGSAEEEVRILRSDDGDTLNLRVRTSQATVGNEIFTIFAVSDISHFRRREELEQVFFHDILNIACAVRGLTHLLEQIPNDQQADLRRRIHFGIDRLIEETDHQRLIAAAERDELKCTFSWISSLDVLNDVVTAFADSPLLRGRELVIDPASEDVAFESDWNLISRIISAMAKNAMEATAPGGTVMIASRSENGFARFDVRNAEAMPRIVALQVFQRSFSTKGRGRGLGTYSMRLLGERYLKGTISFTSTDAEGTTFTATFPVKVSAQS